MIATTHLLTTERSRAQLMGVRGQWVVSAYQQMARFIELRLGRNHLLLFAEPVIAVNAIDWFTAAEGSVKSFAQLDETEQAALLQTTRRLVTDLQQLSEQLSISQQADQNLIGEILQNMLAFPDQSVFQVGEQPVVAGWGVRFNETGLTWRVAAIMQSKTPVGLDAGTIEPLSGVRKARQPVDSPAMPIARRRPGTPASAAPNIDSVVSSEREMASGARWRWMLLTGLLLALLMALLLGLRGCEGIALQWGSLPLAAPREPSVQPAVVEPNVRESVDSLADARQREYQLRQQLAQLQATWLQQQRACRRR